MQQICRKTNSLDFFFQIQKRIVVHIHEIPNVHCPTDVDKAPRLSISIVIWILPSDTETSAATPLGGGARKVLAK